MKDSGMKEMMEHFYHKMRAKRNILFRAFLINYILVFLVWLCSLMPWYQNLLMHFMPMSGPQIQMYLMEIFGLWKIAGVVLFLVPALATWWEMHSFSKKEM
ncbi:MAG: hypothetical protein FWC61_03455 [Proteobacteria bacterium]|nr:hypothetical protein [Pseudomonadota bacterium]